MSLNRDPWITAYFSAQRFSFFTRSYSFPYNFMVGNWGPWEDTIGLIDNVINPSGWPTFALDHIPDRL